VDEVESAFSTVLAVAFKYVVARWMRLLSARTRGTADEFVMRAAVNVSATETPSAKFDVEKDEFNDDTVKERTEEPFPMLLVWFTASALRKVPLT